MTKLLTPLRDDQRGKAPRRARYSRTFYQFLPPPPTVPDKQAARVFLAAVYKAIDRGGWTRAEWGGLRRLQTRWERRVAGDDLRWNIVGSKSGRLPSALEQALKPEPHPIFKDNG